MAKKEESTVNLQIQIDKKLLARVERKISKKKLSHLSVQDLVRIFLAKVAKEGFELDISVNGENEIK